MFDLVKKMLVLVLISSINAVPCISLKNQECKVRETVINNKYMVYPYSVNINKCSGNCNNIISYYRVCIADIIKNITVKVFDLISFQNKTKHIKIDESCKCVCRLDLIVCNNKQRYV